MAQIDNANRRIQSEIVGIFDSVFEWPIAHGSFKREQFYAELTDEERHKIVEAEAKVRSAAADYALAAMEVLDSKRDDLKRLK
jgi:hypothetical protein